MRKKAAILFTAVLAAVLLSACGGADTSKAAGGSQAKEGSAEKSSAEKGTGAESEGSQTSQEKEDKTVSVSDEPYVMVKQENYNKGKLNNTFLFDYDEKGNLIKKTVEYAQEPDSGYYQEISNIETESGGLRVVYGDAFLTKNGEPCEYAVDIGREYEYDAEGRMISEISSVGETTYEYDGDGNLSREIIKVRSTVTTMEYEYDENGFLVKESSYNKEGKLKEYRTYENDSDGRQIHQRVFEPDGSEPNTYERYEWKYEYDEQGRVIEEVCVGTEHGGRTKRRKFSYDENGRVCKEYSEYDNEWYEYLPLSQYLEQAGQ